MPNFRQQRKRRNSMKFSAMGRASQRVQRERREAAVTPEMLAELESAQPTGKGAAIGSLEIRNFISGTVRRWTVIGGNRSNQYRLRTPDGRISASLSATRIMAVLRGRFLK